MATLELSGGRLDLAVVAGRDGIFVIPTSSDLSGYTWKGQVVDGAGELVGDFVIDVTAEQATVTLPAAVSADLPPFSEYEIVLSAGGLDPQVTTLLSGEVKARAGAVTL